MTRLYVCLSKLFPTLISSVSIAALATASAHAQTVADIQKVERSENDKDVVFAYGQRDQDPATIGSAASIITADEIETAQLSFVADALRLAPGVAIARNGAYGGFASAKIRGGSSGQTLVVIDGVVVNDASAPQGGYNFADLDVADVEQIEVLRGPQSLVWGADAIGGVIYIRTKNDGPTLSAFAEGGSRATFRGGATFFTGDDARHLRATVSGLRTDGVSRAAGGAEEDGYRSINASITAGVDVSSSSDLAVTARYGDSHTALDGFAPPMFLFGDTAETEDAANYATSARFRHGLGADFNGALSLSVSGVDRTTRDAGVETFTAKGWRRGAHYIASWRVSEILRLSAGGEFERSAAKVSGVDEKASAGGVFAFAEVTPLPALTLSGGVRRDEFSNFKGATTSRLAGVYTFAQSGGAATRLRASWGEGYRAPTLFELNFDQFGITPNPNLRPERANGFDVGVEHEFNAERSLLRATFFRQRVKDQIEYDFAGAGYYNIGKVNSHGVETEASIALTDQLSMRGVYTFVKAENAVTGAPIARTPKHSGSASLAFQPSEALTLSAGVYFNGREYDVPTPNDSFIKIDLRADYALSDAISVYGRVENVADKTYQDVSGYEEPGISAFAGVRFNR